VLKVEDWAEIRRLHRAEGVPIKEIARRLRVARDTVRAALSSDRPTYQRASRGSVVDPYEPQIRALLKDWPKMPTPTIAQRIGWPYSEGPLKKLLARIRPEYVGIDPVDRVTYEPGQLTQCDLWFPEPRIPVAVGQLRVLPVLVMTLAFSRFLTATTAATGGESPP
jgi:transposase